MIRLKEFDCFSEQGIRANNEDYILPSKYQRQQRIFVLCDGMGGHGHGEVASQIVGESVYRFLLSQMVGDNYEFTTDVLQQSLDFAIEELDRADTFDEDERRMGTTLVVVVLNKFDILVGHVGDSRCYMFDNNWNITFCTNDHSEVAEAVRRGFITKEEAFKHPKKNIITRSVQAGKSVSVEIDKLENVLNGYRLLLCTDGVHDTLRDTEMEALLSQPAVSGYLSVIKEECSQKSQDNYSAILIEILQDERLPELESLKKDHDGRMLQNEDFYCDNCKGKIPVGAQFCPGCGKNRFQPSVAEIAFIKEDLYWDFGVIKVRKEISFHCKCLNIILLLGGIVVLILVCLLWGYKGSRNENHESMFRSAKFNENIEKKYQEMEKDMDALKKQVKELNNSMDHLINQSEE